MNVGSELLTCGLPVLAVDCPQVTGVPSLDTWPEDAGAMQETLRAFVFDVCGAEANWNMADFIEDQVEQVRAQVGDKKVLLALSGGVDSSVVAALLLRAIGGPAHLRACQSRPAAQRGARNRWWRFSAAG